MPHVTGIGADLLHAKDDVEGLLTRGSPLLDQTAREVAPQQEDREASDRGADRGHIGDDVPAEGRPDRHHPEGISGAFYLCIGVFKGEERDRVCALAHTVDTLVRFGILSPESSPSHSELEAAAKIEVYKKMSRFQGGDVSPLSRVRFTARCAPWTYTLGPGDWASPETALRGAPPTANWTAS